MLANNLACKDKIQHKWYIEISYFSGSRPNNIDEGVPSGTKYLIKFFSL